MRFLENIRSCRDGGRIAALQVPSVVSFDEISGIMEWAREANERENGDEEYLAIGGRPETLAQNGTLDQQFHDGRVDRKVLTR